MKITPAERETMIHVPTIDELQQTIGAWCEATFPDQTDRRIVNHLREELDELHETILMADTHGVETSIIADDCADIAILLLALAHRCGFSLGIEICHKHEINTGRTWAFNPALGYDKHVQD